MEQTFMNSVVIGLKNEYCKVRQAINGLPFLWKN